MTIGARFRAEGPPDAQADALLAALCFPPSPGLCEIEKTKLEEFYEQSGTATKRNLPLRTRCFQTEYIEYIEYAHVWHLGRPTDAALEAGQEPIAHPAPDSQASDSS